MGSFFLPSSSVGKQSQLLLKPTEVELGLQVGVEFDKNMVQAYLTIVVLDFNLEPYLEWDLHIYCCGEDIFPFILFHVRIIHYSLETTRAYLVPPSNLEHLHSVKFALLFHDILEYARFLPDTLGFLYPSLDIL